MQNNNSHAKSIVRDFIFVVSSFVVAFGTVSRQKDETRVSVQLGAFLACLGSVFFVAFTNLLNQLQLRTQAGLKFIKRFNLSISDCVDITNK
jgi:hypothetical protein